MAYDEYLADRIRMVFREKGVTVKEKRMMGGLCFMVNDKMCAGVVDERLMARVAPEEYEQALTRPGCREMDFTGRAMRGLVYVEGEGIEEDDDLAIWLQLCLDYNPRARSSKRHK